MPFQPINFASIPPQGAPVFRDLIQTLMQGYQAGQMPFQMKRQAQQEELANAINRQKMQEEPDRFSAWKNSQPIIDALRQAQALKTQQDAQNPYRNVPSGDIGQRVGLEVIGKQFGYDSPQYLDAKKKYDLNNQNVQSQIDYRNTLGNTADKRYATTLGKTQLELDDVEAGFLPNTGRSVKLNPDEQEILKGEYQNKKLKETTDLNTRERVLNAQNAETSLNSVNVPALTQYGGAQGQIQFKADQALAAAGNPSQNFKNFQQATTQAIIAAKQMRASLKDSVSPSNLEKYDDLTQPATWTIDPETATLKFNTLKDLYKKEMGTFKGALKSPKAYEPTKSLIGTVNGKQFKVSPENRQKFIDKYGQGALSEK